MKFDTVNAVLLAIAFLVPGFLLSAVLAMYFPRRSRAASSLTLQYLLLSCLNHGFWSWLIVLMIHGRWITYHPARTAALVCMILFVSPIVMGVVLGRLGSHEVVQRALSAIGFMIYRFIPTAWDYRFMEETPAWLIVTLKDGSRIFGFYGDHSFAGDEAEERDLFIEAVFTPQDAGPWQPVPDTAGILIRASEIATVEFRRVDDLEGAA